MKLDLLHFSIGVQRDYETYHTTKEGGGGGFSPLETKFYDVLYSTNTGVYHLCDMRDSLPCIHNTLFDHVLETPTPRKGGIEAT
jgi:hypothetical protein